jgi:hypothetical protein
MRYCFFCNARLDNISAVVAMKLLRSSVLRLLIKSSLPIEFSSGDTTKVVVARRYGAAISEESCRY